MHLSRHAWASSWHGGQHWLLLCYSYQAGSMLWIRYKYSSMLCIKHQYYSSMLCTRHQYGSMLCIRHHNYGSISLHHASVIMAHCCASMAQWYQASICGSMLCIRHQYGCASGINMAVHHALLWLNSVYHGSIWLNNLHHASVWLSTVHHASKLWHNPVYHGSMLCIHSCSVCIRKTTHFVLEEQYGPQ